MGLDLIEMRDIYENKNYKEHSLLTMYARNKLRIKNCLVIPQPYPDPCKIELRGCLLGKGARGPCTCLTDLFHPRLFNQRHLAQCAYTIRYLQQQNLSSLLSRI